VCGVVIWRQEMVDKVKRRYRDASRNKLSYSFFTADLMILF